MTKRKRRDNLIREELKRIRFGSNPVNIKYILNRDRELWPILEQLQNTYLDPNTTFVTSWPL